MLRMLPLNQILALELSVNLTCSAFEGQKLLLVSDVEKRNFPARRSDNIFLTIVVHRQKRSDRIRFPFNSLHRTPLNLSRIVDSKLVRLIRQRTVRSTRDCFSFVGKRNRRKVNRNVELQLVWTHVFRGPNDALKS